MGRDKLRFIDYSAAALEPYSYPVAQVPQSSWRNNGACTVRSASLLATQAAMYSSGICEALTKKGQDPREEMLNSWVWCQSILLVVPSSHHGILCQPWPRCVVCVIKHLHHILTSHRKWWWEIFLWWWKKMKEKQAK